MNFHEFSTYCFRAFCVELLARCSDSCSALPIAFVSWRACGWSGPGSKLARTLLLLRQSRAFVLLLACILPVRCRSLRGQVQVFVLARPACFQWCRLRLGYFLLMFLGCFLSAILFSGLQTWCYCFDLPGMAAFKQAFFAAAVFFFAGRGHLRLRGVES